MKFRHALFSWIRMCKKHDSEIENEGNVQKYMPQSEIDEQRSSLRIMTQRLPSLAILLLAPLKQ